MGIRCRSCKLEFPFEPERAGEVIECPYCDRENTKPMTDPDGYPEPAEDGQADSAIDGARSAVPPIVPLNGSSVAATFQLPCPSCKRELKLYFFDRIDPLCPHCKASLCDVELPTARQIAAAADSPADARAIGAIFERLAAQKEQQATALPRVVAEWMVSEFDRRERHLPLQQAITQIRKKFGDEVIQRNDGGEWTIVQTVLDEFQKLTTDCVVWDRGGEFWRERKPGEKPAPRPIPPAVAKPVKRGRKRKSGD